VQRVDGYRAGGDGRLHRARGRIHGHRGRELIKTLVAISQRLWGFFHIFPSLCSAKASLTESRIGAVRRRQTVDLLAVAYDLDDSRHPPDGLKAVDPMLT